jgi:hypothetical protein
MAKLTKKQKNLIKVIKYYHAEATKELEVHGVTPKYDAHMWMVVFHSDEIGCDVASFERDAADRYWARTTAAA